MRLHLRRALLFLSVLALVSVLSLHLLQSDTSWLLGLPGQRFLTKARHFQAGFPTTLEPKPNVWEINEKSDRIIEQINFKPKNYEKTMLKNTTKPKLIYIHGGIGDFNAKLGKKEFQRQECRVQNCYLTISELDAAKADAILFRQTVSLALSDRLATPHQVWIYFTLEAPYSLPSFEGLENIFNWTATYRRDSTIVAPYEKWTPFDPPVDSPSVDRNFAAGKTKQVAWFVSNCGANNNRLEYAHELGKHIDVDIFGFCGNNDCPKFNQDCWERLNEDYKFYLAFENANCRDYITEKFFQNGLGYDVIPIVMGAHPDDYRKVAPPHSYISVEDFEDPKSLAEYLIKLDNDDKKYNQYFRWKGTGRFINTKFWCRVCALLNDEDKPTRIIGNFQEWWNGEGICRRTPWTSKRKF